MPGRAAVALGAIAAATVLLLHSGMTDADTPATATAGAAHDGQHDFDFLVGSWKIHLKKRLRPLTGSNEWVEFDGTVVSFRPGSWLRRCWTGWTFWPRTVIGFLWRLVDWRRCLRGSLLRRDLRPHKETSRTLRRDHLAAT